MCVDVYTYIYFLALSTERAKEQSAPSAQIDPCQLFSQPWDLAGVQVGESSPKAKQRTPVPAYITLG